MLKIIEFSEGTVLKNSILQERATSARWAHSRQFIATIDNVEAGFLSFEDRSDISMGMVYEILVLPKFRNKGIGFALLSRAETLAISLGCNRVHLKANAFDRSVRQEWLEGWYARKGYNPTSESSQDFDKWLPASTTLPNRRPPNKRFKSLPSCSGTAYCDLFNPDVGQSKHCTPHSCKNFQ